MSEEPLYPNRTLSLTEPCGPQKKKKPKKEKKGKKKKDKLEKVHIATKAGPGTSQGRTQGSLDSSLG